MTDRSSSTTGKVALVTGATSGIGRAAAISLVHCGYRIIVVGRDANRGVGVVDELERVGAGGAFLPCDLLDLADVRRLALEGTEHHRRLDVLLNNAGGTFRAKALTQDGVERTFALNVVAPYALTAALLSPLRAGEGRVVNVVTQVSARTRLEIDGLIDPPRYNAFAAYSRAKLALMALTSNKPPVTPRRTSHRWPSTQGSCSARVSVTTCPPGLTGWAPSPLGCYAAPRVPSTRPAIGSPMPPPLHLTPAPSSPKRGPTNLPPLRPTPSSKSGSGSSSRLSRIQIRSPEACSLATPYPFRHHPHRLRGRLTGGPVSLRVGRVRFVTLAAGPLPTLSMWPQEGKPQTRGLDRPNPESRRAGSNRLPLLITSDPSGVAGVCTTLQIPHISTAFLS